MNLEEFISQSLSQIAKGIEKANEELKDSQALVSPKGVVDITKDNRYGNIKVEDSWLKVHEISFDVGVTVVEGSESGGKLGVSVGGFSIGANGKENQANTSASRIQFSVPMVLPQVLYVKK
ncbi:hypothetical protein KS670_004927 [Vibrio parahaemolyticus]|nr:hypothetical protein [Vibrio parahaemolyticus]